MESYIGVVLGAIIAFLIFRLLRQKVPKPKIFVKSHDQNRDDRDKNIPRNVGYIFMAVGTTLLGIAVFLGIQYTPSMLLLLPGFPGVLFFIIGLILLIGFYIQKLIAKRKESPK